MAKIYLQIYLQSIPGYMDTVLHMWYAACAIHVFEVVAELEGLREVRTFLEVEE